MKLIVHNNRNPLELQLPKMLYDDRLYSEDRHAFALRRLNVFSVSHQRESSAFGWVTLMGLSHQEVLDAALQDLPLRMVAVAPYLFHNQYRLPYLHENRQYPLVISRHLQTFAGQHNYQELSMLQYAKSTANLKSHVSPALWKRKSYIPRAMCNLPIIQCSSAHFQRHQQDHAVFHRRLIYGHPDSLLQLVPRSLQENEHKIEIPDYMSLIADSTKLKYLDRLLVCLKKGNHRCLIFCQMTKMMDILEDYLAKKKYRFFRLDGSSNIADRRDMVTEY